MSDLALRIAALALALAAAETLHGIARVTWLVPKVGLRRAQRLGIVTGSLLAVGICRLGVPPLGLHHSASLLALGLGLSAFMAAFDLSLARWVARRPWAHVWADFDPRQGNYLIFGLLVLALAPWLVTGGR
jgi:hypothetical protein